MTNREFIRSWVRGYNKKSRQGNLIAGGDEILYSYGKHFPLAVKIGRNFLVNRDSSSTSTATQQSLAVQEIGTFSCLEIPFELLDKIGGYEGVAIHDIASETGVISKNDKYYYAGLDEKDQYFLTELSGAAHTVTEAEDLLRPEGVPLDAKRQGEFFFAEVEELPEDHPEPERKYTIEDSSHFATRGFAHKGEIFVKGTVRHEGSEHSMLKLYEDTNNRSWHKVYESQREASYSANGSTGGVRYD